MFYAKTLNTDMYQLKTERFSQKDVTVLHLFEFSDLWTLLEQFPLRELIAQTLLGATKHISTYTRNVNQLTRSVLQLVL